MLKKLFLLILLVLIAAGAYVAYAARTFLNTPGSAEVRDVIITIEPGDTFDRVAWRLKKEGVITDVMRFRLLARWEKALGSVKAGDFKVSTGWLPERVLYQITKGQSLLPRLAIREGLTWWETAKVIEAAGFATYEDFKAVIHDPEFLAAHSIPFENAEGFLYPETYMLKKPKVLDREQARIVADMLVTHFWKRNEALWRHLPYKADGQTVHVSTPPPLADSGIEAPASQTGETGANTTKAPQNATLAAANTPTATPGNSTTQAVNATAASGSAENSQVPTGQAPATTATNSTEQDAPPAANATSSEGAGAGGNATSPEGTSAAEDNSSVVPPFSGLTFGPATPADIEPEALRQWLILATLVEKETGVPSERARVAGVYANRIRLGMLLQCDPTIIYGVGESFKHPIRRSQLNDEGNLYNTYKHPGLPPGPICSPGFQALAAAMTPEEHGYLFFVATGKADGSHTFSKTVGEHNKAVKEYRRVIQNGR